MKNLIFFISILLLSGCISKTREDELIKQQMLLETKINDLLVELDECQNGAEKLYSKMNLSYTDKDYETCKSYFIEIQKRHPESKQFALAKKLHDKIIYAEKKKKDQRLKALKRLKKEQDDISGVTWYKQPYFTHYNNRNLMSAYIGSHGISPYLRLKMSYTGDDWIFFERAYLSYDGKTKVINFDEYNDKKSDNSGYGVWEWIDVYVDSELLNYLRDFSNSKNAKMRLSGKYTKTRNLTYNERKGLRDVISGYDALIEVNNK